MSAPAQAMRLSPVRAIRKPQFNPIPRHAKVKRLTFHMAGRFSTARYCTSFQSVRYCTHGHLDGGVMKRFLAVMFLAAYSALAYADGCVTQTFTQGSRVVICTTCCFMGSCNTTCY